MGRKHSTTKRIDIVACIESGMSCREAAALVGVSVASAIRWTKRAGVISRRSKLLPPETREGLIEAMRSGLPPARAAARFRVSAQTAARLDPTVRQARNREQQRKALSAALEQGLSRRQAAEQIGVSVATAIRWARASGPTEKAPSAPPPDVLRDARAAIEAGMSHGQAALAFGVPLATTARFARRPRSDPEREAKRARLIAAVEAGLSRRKAAEAIGLPIATAIRWAHRAASTDRRGV